ncbi:MAG: hypothetical protein KDI02_19370, partial [Anaerolineae bacterium]|nr:hypothetical protein [Anaerolineae bacterium]
DDDKTAGIVVVGPAAAPFQPYFLLQIVLLLTSFWVRASINRALSIDQQPEDNAHSPLATDKQKREISIFRYLSHALS